jgi:hypothetical protein
VIGEKALDAVNATRGGKKPRSVADTSSFAEALGVVVPIPVWAKTAVLRKRNKIRYFFMFI